MEIYFVFAAINFLIWIPIRIIEHRLNKLDPWTGTIVGGVFFVLLSALGTAGIIMYWLSLYVINRLE
jgi:hypothetical protein